MELPVVDSHTDPRTTSNHRRKLGHGLCSGDDALPNRDNYVYFPAADAWVRLNSKEMQERLKKNYILLSNPRVLVKRTPYNADLDKDGKKIVTRTSEECIGNISENLISTKDVLLIILRLACVEKRAYMCLRSTNKRFKAFIDEYISMVSFFFSRVGGGRERAVVTGAYNWKIHHAPLHVQKLLCDNYPQWVVQRTYNKGIYRLLDAYLEHHSVEGEMQYKNAFFKLARERNPTLTHHSLKLLVKYYTFSAEELSIVIYLRHSHRRDNAINSKEVKNTTVKETTERTPMGVYATLLSAHIQAIKTKTAPVIEISKRTVGTRMIFQGKNGEAITARVVIRIRDPIREANEVGDMVCGIESQMGDIPQL